LSNAISEHQAARAAQQAADQKLLSTLSPSDPAHQAAFARVVERRHQAEIEASAAARVTAARRFIDRVHAYADTVKAVERDVAKIQPGPVLPTQRQFARKLLHNGEPQALAATPGNFEPGMAQLLAVVMGGQFLINNPETSDPIVLEQLSQAEAAAWAALIRRAQFVAGEAAI
jgi:hypothetical protein